MRAKKRKRLLLVFSEKQQAKAKRSESKKRKQLQSRAKIAEVRVENRCVTPKGATHPFGFWHTSFRQACSGPACLPRATKRSVQSGGETCRRRGSTGSRPSQGSGGQSTWRIGGRARGSRPGWAVLPCAPSTRHRGAAEAPRGWARDADGQRKRAAGPQPRNKDAKQVLVEEEGGQAGAGDVCGG